jgi:outer membrane protein OmpA-like peptidoglycan-associated protein
LTGCASKSYITLLESPDGSTGKVILTGARGEQVIDRAGQGAPLDGSKAAAPVDPETLKKDFAAAMAARPQLPERFLLYFEAGGARLTAESAALLPQIIVETGKRSVVDMSIIGHTDTAGKAEANEALALKRAEGVANLFREAGLKVHTLTVESHGERNLLVPTPDNTAEARNRRVEVSVR